MDVVEYILTQNKFNCIHCFDTIDEKALGVLWTSRSCLSYWIFSKLMDTIWVFASIDHFRQAYHCMMKHSVLNSFCESSRLNSIFHWNWFVDVGVFLILGFYLDNSWLVGFFTCWVVQCSFVVVFYTYVICNFSWIWNFYFRYVYSVLVHIIYYV